MYTCLMSADVLKNSPSMTNMSRAIRLKWMGLRFSARNGHMEHSVICTDLNLWGPSLIRLGLLWVTGELLFVDAAIGFFCTHRWPLLQ
jgi:hypothetical protein